MIVDDLPPGRDLQVEELLYRGVDPSSDPELFSTGILRPPAPLGTYDSFDAILLSDRTDEHVRRSKNRHGRSLSLSMHVARYWATGGYRRNGFVAVFPVTFARMVTYAGSPPYHLETAGGERLVDPRNLPFFSRVHPLFGQEVRNYSRVDEELILVGGAMQVAAIIPVTPEVAAHERHDPYDTWGQHFARFGGTVLPAQFVR